MLKEIFFVIVYLPICLVVYIIGMPCIFLMGLPRFLSQSRKLYDKNFT